MARVVILFALVALSGVIAQSPKFNQIRENRNDTSLLARIAAGAAGTAADLTAFPFIVTVWDPATVATTAASTNTDQGYGPCVIINCKYYVLCHSDLHKAVTDVTTLRAAASSLIADGTGTSPTPLIRKVKQRYLYVDPNPNIIQKFQIFRVCPSFPSASAYKLTTVAPPTTAGTPYVFVNYDTTKALQTGTKNIGESCECDGYTTANSYPDYTTIVDPATWCGQGHATIFVQNTDKTGSIGIVDDAGVKKFAGINVATAQGELFLDPYVTAVKAWIDTTAPVCT